MISYSAFANLIAPHEKRHNRKRERESYKDSKPCCGPGEICGSGHDWNNPFDRRAFLKSLGGATAGTVLALHGTKIELLGWISYSTLMHCSAQCEVSISDAVVLITSTAPDPMKPGKDKIQVMILFSFNHTCACWGGSPEGVGEFEHGFGGTCTIEGAPAGNQWQIDWKGFGGVGADADPPPENLEVDNGSFDLMNAGGDLKAG